MKLYTFLANGFETIEALCVVDIMRRGGIDVTTVSINSDKEVVSAQNIKVIADATFDEVDFSDGDALFLPGGMPGTTNLEAHEGLKNLIFDYYKNDKYLIAICAAPSILGHFGLLEGKKATCYPGFEKDLEGALYKGDGVVEDGKVITARGMGKTIDLGLKLLKIFDGNELAVKIGNGIQYLV